MYEDFLSISVFLFVLLRKPHNHLFYSTAADSFKKDSIMQAVLYI